MTGGGVCCAEVFALFVAKIPVGGFDVGGGAVGKFYGQGHAAACYVGYYEGLGLGYYLDLDGVGTWTGAVLAVYYFVCALTGFFGVEFSGVVNNDAWRGAPYSIYGWAYG